MNPLERTKISFAIASIADITDVGFWQIEEALEGLCWSEEEGNELSNPLDK